MFHTGSAAETGRTVTVAPKANPQAMPRNEFTRGLYQIYFGRGKRRDWNSWGAMSRDCRADGLAVRRPGYVSVTTFQPTASAKA